MVSPSPAIFVVGAIFAWRPGLAAIRRVFLKTSIAAGLLLVIVQSVYVLEAHQINGMTQVAIGLLVRALILEALIVLLAPSHSQFNDHTLLPLVIDQEMAMEE